VLAHLSPSSSRAHPSSFLYIRMDFRKRLAVLDPDAAISMSAGGQHEVKHSVNFLLNSSNSSLPRLPLSTSTTTTGSGTSNSLPLFLDDVASTSTSTKADSENSPFDELLTAANLLERNSVLNPMPTLPQMVTPPINTAKDPTVVGYAFPALSQQQSPGSSVVSGGRVTKRRKKRASVPCDQCGRLFGEAAAVRKHKRVVHLKVKDFACDVCSRKFAEKSNLKKHILARHQQTRSHKCTECGKVFNFTDGLRRHYNNCHLGLRPYKCDICPSGFKQRTHLQKHKLSVHNIKPEPKSSSTAQLSPISDGQATATTSTSTQ